MKNLIQIFTVLAFCFFALACNKPDEVFCLLGPTKDVQCNYNYKPVCGCNNVTYGNECVADAAGVPSFTPGRCQ